MKKGQSVL